MLRIAFLARPTNLALHVVQAVAGDPCHVEVLFRDGASFTSWPGHGVGYRTLDPRGAWQVYDRPDLDEARGRAFCDRLAATHAGYDWPRILLWPLGLGLNSNRLYGCDEVAAAVLVAAGDDPALLAACRDPRALAAAVHARVRRAGTRSA